LISVEQDGHVIVGSVMCLLTPKRRGSTRRSWRHLHEAITKRTLTFGHALFVDAESAWQGDAACEPFLPHEARLTQR
jgi:hypothetical protein